MKKLIINFTKHGAAIRDTDCFIVARNLCEELRDGKPRLMCEPLDFYEHIHYHDDEIKFNVCSVVFINIIRVFVYRGIIALDNIEITYNNDNLHLDSNGRLRNWARDMEMWDKTLGELLDPPGPKSIETLEILLN